MISLRAREIFKVNGEAFTEEELNDIFGKQSRVSKETDSSKCSLR